ncbi:hypothetical protein [Streptomyces sp. NPDC050287]|uniref:hypothetical protein n=1 Tax=Streptomyces sp. NPDC050287 TaxID=3365608 RepID=UPI0037A148D0
MHRVIAPSVRTRQTGRRLARLRAEVLVDRITLPQAGRTRVWFPHLVRRTTRLRVARDERPALQNRVRSDHRTAEGRPHADRDRDRPRGFEADIAQQRVVRRAVGGRTGSPVPRLQ